MFGSREHSKNKLFACKVAGPEMRQIMHLPAASDAHSYAHLLANAVGAPSAGILPSCVFVAVRVTQMSRLGLSVGGITTMRVVYYLGAKSFAAVLLARGPIKTGAFRIYINLTWLPRRHDYYL